MEFMMKIREATVIQNIGFVIIGGNREITKEDTSKLCKTGQDIIVKYNDEDLVFKVADIKLSFSISEKVIIGIRLEDSDSLGKIKAGDLVYKIRPE